MTAVVLARRHAQYDEVPGEADQAARDARKNLQVLQWPVQPVPRDAITTPSNAPINGPHIMPRHASSHHRKGMLERGFELIIAIYDITSSDQPVNSFTDLTRSLQPRRKRGCSRSNTDKDRGCWRVGVISAIDHLWLVSPSASQCCCGSGRTSPVSRGQLARAATPRRRRCVAHLIPLLPANKVVWDRGDSDGDG